LKNVLIFIFIFNLITVGLYSESLSIDEKKNIVEEKKKKEEKIIFISTSRDFLNNVLLGTTNTLDYIFSIGYTKVKRKKNSYVDAKIGGFYEKFYGYGYDYNVDGFIDLPNTKKRFNIFIGSLYQNNKGENNDNLLNKDKKEKFILGFEYTRTLFNVLRSGLSTGAIFNSYYLDPFLRFSVNTSFNLFSNWNLSVGNYAYYFLVYKFDNLSFISLSYNISKQTQIKIYNEYRYREYFDKLHEVKNVLGLHHLISNTMGINYTLEVLRKKDGVFSYGISYYYIGTSFKHVFYSDWLYYEIKPGFYFRENNNFNLSPKMLIFIGMIYRTE
jgi:hypothetical protein